MDPLKQAEYFIQVFKPNTREYAINVTGMTESEISMYHLIISLLDIIEDLISSNAVKEVSQL